MGHPINKGSIKEMQLIDSPALLSPIQKIRKKSVSKYFFSAYTNDGVKIEEERTVKALSVKMNISLFILNKALNNKNYLAKGYKIVRSNEKLSSNIEPFHIKKIRSISKYFFSAYNNKGVKIEEERTVKALSDKIKISLFILNKVLNNNSFAKGYKIVRSNEKSPNCIEPFKIKKKKYISFKPSHLYGAYDHYGIKVKETDSLRDMATYFKMSQSGSIRKAIDNNGNVKNHKIRTVPIDQKLPNSIEPFDTNYIIPFSDKRGTRLYLIYKQNGDLWHSEAVGLGRASDLLKCNRSSITDSVKNHGRVKGKIITLVKTSATFVADIFIPKKLSPLHPAFSVFKFNKSGCLVGYFSSIAEAESSEDDSRSIIEQCIKDGASRGKYFYADMIPSTNYKNRSVKFKNRIKKLVEKTVQLKVTMKDSTEFLSIRNTANLLETDYNNLVERLKKEKRFILNNALIEGV